MNLNTSLSLGEFREEIRNLKPPFLTRNEPLEPLNISMQADHISIVLGASSYIALRSGNTSVTLSHIMDIIPSAKPGRKKRGQKVERWRGSYLIVCGDYTLSDDPRPVKYYLTFPY